MIGISIVVPISGRTFYLKQLLESFQLSIKPDIPTELLIIDNSRNEQHSILIKELTRQFNVEYHLTERGVVRARNHGATQAKYDYLLFIDSDCTLDRNILVEYEKSIGTEKINCSAGKTIFSGQESIWWRLLKDSHYLFPFKWCEWNIRLLWAPMSNFLVKKDIFYSVGGFNSVLSPREASEDVDFGIRLSNSGYTISRSPGCIVYHTTDTWNRLSSIVERFFRFGRGEARLIQLHKKYRLGLPSLAKFVSVALILLLVSVLMGFKTLSKALVLSIPIALITNMTVAWIQKPKILRSLPRFFFMKLIEFLYDSGKSFQALKEGKFLTFKFFAFSNESYVSQWEDNIILFYTYLLTIIITICLYV